MAKPAAAAPTSTKNKGAAVAARRRSRARRAARRANPSGGGGGGSSEVVDTLKTVGIGVGAYGGTRVVQRLAWTVVAKKKPAWAKHAHAAAGVATFGAAWLAGRKVKALAPFHEALLLGSGVAAAQSLVAVAVPRLAWLMGDPRLDELGPVRNAAALPAPTAAGDDDPLEAQLVAYERGARRTRAPVNAALQTAAAADGDPGIDESLLEELGAGESIDDLYGGLFEDPTLST
jgi:hypothetical protein